MSKRIQCPRCGQEWLRYARVRETGSAVVVCSDCEATWLVGQNISTASQRDLGTLLAEEGVVDGTYLDSLETRGFLSYAAPAVEEP